MYNIPTLLLHVRVHAHQLSTEKSCSLHKKIARLRFFFQKSSTRCELAEENRTGNKSCAAIHVF